MKKITGKEKRRGWGKEDERGKEKKRDNYKHE